MFKILWIQVNLVWNLRANSFKSGRNLKKKKRKKKKKKRKKKGKKMVLRGKKGLPVSASGKKWKILVENWRIHWKMTSNFWIFLWNLTKSQKCLLKKVGHFFGAIGAKIFSSGRASAASAKRKFLACFEWWKCSENASIFQKLKKNENFFLGLTAQKKFSFFFNFWKIEAFSEHFHHSKQPRNFLFALAALARPDEKILAQSAYGGRAWTQWKVVRGWKLWFGDGNSGFLEKKLEKGGFLGKKFLGKIPKKWIFWVFGKKSTFFGKKWVFSWKKKLKKRGFLGSKKNFVKNPKKRGTFFGKKLLKNGVFWKFFFWFKNWKKRGIFLGKNC